MKIGFIYAGQGSQYVGMGKEFYETSPACRELLDGVSLDFDYKQMMFEGDMTALSQTSHTQPCMVAVAMMATLLLKEKGITPAYTCGLSLGEYSALACANVFTPAQAIEIVRKRGLAMEKAAKGIDSKMCAIIGMDRETLQKTIDTLDPALGYVAIANYNCPGQLVVGGEERAVDALSNAALENGARRAIPLNTSGPFHTKLLKAASEELHEYFKHVTFGDMQIPVIFNSTGKELDASVTIAQMLEKQVMSPVYFEDSIRYMIAHGVDTIIEIGPGKVLSGFVRKIDRSIKTYHVEDNATLAKVVGELGE